MPAFLCSWSAGKRQRFWTERELGASDSITDVEIRTMSVHDVTVQHHAVFKAEVGEVQGLEVTIHLQTDARLRFLKPKACASSAPRRSDAS